MWERIYDGSIFCSSGGCCPVVEVNRGTGHIRLHDPDKPGSGCFILTVKEYKTLLENAPRLP